MVRLSLMESTGTAPATVRLWDGASTTGQLKDPISLSAGQSTRDYYKLYQYRYENGLFLEIVSGAVEGCVDVIPWDKWPHHHEPLIVVSPEVLVASLTVGT